MAQDRGTWVARWVKLPTLGFGSGHDLQVGEFKPHLGLCIEREEPAWDSFPLSLTHSCSLYLSLKINRLKKQKKNGTG